MGKSIFILVAICVLFILTIGRRGGAMEGDSTPASQLESSHFAEGDGVITSQMAAPGRKAVSTRELLEVSTPASVSGTLVGEGEADSEHTTIIATVVHPNGVHCSGVSVEAIVQLSETERGQATSNESSSTKQTTEAGVALFQVPAWGPDHVCRVQIRAYSQFGEFANQSLKLISGEVRKTTLTLREGVMHTGRVVSALDGKPLAGVLVVAGIDKSPSSTTTDEAGNFSLPVVSTLGSGLLSFRSELYADEEVSTSFRSDGPWGASLWGYDGRVVLTDESPPIFLEVVLSPARSISGRIVMADKSPIAGARVSFSGNYQTEPGTFSMDNGSAASDASGRFQVTGLRADINHAMSVEADNFAFFQMLVPPIEHPNDTSVELGVLIMDAATPIRGRVLNFEGAQVGGLLIRTESVERPRIFESDWAISQGEERGAPFVTWPSLTTCTASDGSFRLSGCRTGGYRLSVLDEYKRPLPAYFGNGTEPAIGYSVPAGAEAEIISINLSSDTASLRCWVKFPDDWSSAYVELSHRLTSDSRRLTVEPDGSYLVHGVYSDNFHQYEVRAFWTQRDGRVRGSVTLALDKAAAGEALTFPDQ